MFLNQRMRSQELANPPAECARAVSVNDPDSRLVRQRSIVQEFVQAIRGFFMVMPITLISSEMPPSPR